MDAETPIERDEAMPERDPRPRDGAREGAPAPRPPSDLRSALRTARIEDAERSRAIADVRGAEIARLDLLREAIEPVLAQVPGDVEMFDAGLIPVPQPRLFIDMIAFVEMAHDKRCYRFVQDTRQGRVRLAESESLEVMRGAITAYIARRLIEREKALAADAAGPEPSPAERARPSPSRLDPDWLAESARPYALRQTAPTPPRRPGEPVPWLRSWPNILLNYLGIVALCVLLWVLGRMVYQYVMRLMA